ncbi:integrase core domain-containing protein [Nocardia niigatensis]|uniref:integrase core domain-containing protein n=1 Tax=Nocardia niigatensis TaxID=209249 RepID=UPI0009FC77B1|nr:integrase core domain-containing protein [Nocardia niigatensis]
MADRERRIAPTAGTYVVEMGAAELSEAQARLTEAVRERSITAEKLVTELEKVFTIRGGPPRVLRMDNGPEMISAALQQFCADRVGIVYIPPGTPWNNGFIESFNRRLRAECFNRNHWTSRLEARVVIGDFKTEHNHQHRHSALGYLTPAEYSARCGHTHPPWPATSTETGSNITRTRRPGVPLSGTGQSPNHSLPITKDAPAIPEIEPFARSRERPLTRISDRLEYLSPAVDGSAKYECPSISSTYSVGRPMATRS